MKGLKNLIGEMMTDKMIRMKELEKEKKDEIERLEYALKDMKSSSRSSIEVWGVSVRITGDKKFTSEKRLSDELIEAFKGWSNEEFEEILKTQIRKKKAELDWIEKEQEVI